MTTRVQQHFALRVTDQESGAVGVYGAGANWPTAVFRASGRRSGVRRKAAGRIAFLSVDAGMVVLRPRGKKLSFRRLIKRICTHSVTLDRLTSQKVRVPHRKFIAKVFMVRAGAVRASPNPLFRKEIVVAHFSGKFGPHFALN